MNKEERNIVENVERNAFSKKEELDQRLEAVKTIPEATSLYQDAKQALEKQEIDAPYLKYVVNAIEDKIFCDAKFDKIGAKVLLEVICPSLCNKQDIQLDNLEVKEVGAHFEEQQNYIDKICTYGHEFVCLYGIAENNPEKIIKYEERKFTRQDMVEAVCAQYEEGKKIDLHQYDEYYVAIEKDRLKVFTERKIVALMKVEETTFDKIKAKIANFLSRNPFSKKKYLPILNVVYDTNPNRLKDFEHKSKVDAKNRMKVLLNKEREITRSTNE